jgi:uncharacterized DUF497 family protein
MRFEWDEEKDLLNRKKHGVSFSEASSVWDDHFNIEFFDPDHSFDEDRFLMVGESSNNRLLIISFAERKNRIRIITARELTPAERRTYEHGYFE